MAAKMDPIRPTDAEAVNLAKTLVRSARFGSLAVLDSSTGAPMVSRVATATDLDGSPVVLVSELSPHTGSMKSDPRVSLLLGEPGKGDPLAHPRITLFCQASVIDHDSEDHSRIARRYLNRHPKAELYADFADFSHFKLAMTGASLNGGFGKAYRLSKSDLETVSAANGALADLEQSAIVHMNQHHRDTVQGIAAALKHRANDWTITGIDADGVDLACGDATARVFFSVCLNDISELRQFLTGLARTAAESQ
jgi:putative heme iron utilization protein